MNNFNLMLFNFINGGAGYYHYLDSFVLFLTSYLAYGVSIAMGVYMLIWLPYKRSVPLERLHAMGRGAELALSAFFTWFIVKIIKIIVANPRPFVTLKDIHVLAPYESGYSFPSGHSSMTAAIATVVYFYNKRLGLLLYGFALVVGVSRVYVGVHYPVDVIAGLIIGYFIPYLVHRIFFRKRPKTTL